MSKDLNFFTVPEENVSIRSALLKRSKELDLIINPYMEHKIIWSESHGGRCMCDWEGRTCPCKYILKDLVDFGGQCLCKVLVTKEKMEKIENDNKKFIKKKEKTKESNEKNNVKIKEIKFLAKKIGCKTSIK